MNGDKMEKQQILVVDDEEINREILMEMFHDDLDEYELLEACNLQIGRASCRERVSF